jgi:hypothetical protein
MEEWMKKKNDLLEQLETFKTNKWLKICRGVFVAIGLYVIMIAPRQFDTIPTGLFYLAEILLATFAASYLAIGYLEYYLKETKKGWRNKRKAVILGIALLVGSIVLFLIVKFSGLSEKIFPGFYGTQ